MWPARQGNNIDAGGDVSILADVERARMSDVGAVTASVTAGAVGLSGGGIDIENTIANTVNAFISGPIRVTADGDVSVVASEDAYIVGDATAVSVSVSLGAGLGVALVENEIGSTIQAWVDEATVTSNNTLIHADSVANVAKTISCGVSGSAILGVQGNEATANIKTLVKAYADDATLNSRGDVSILATAMNTANTNAKGGAFGAIAVGAMVSDVNLGRGDDVYEVEAAVGSGTKIYARTLRITAASEDDLLAESTAGGGGAVAAAGAESDVTSNQATLARIGAGAGIEVGGLVMNSLHMQDVDTSADSYAFAAAAGSGAGVSNTITTRANVDIGAGAVVNAGNILINAKNELTKDDYKDSSNLRSGSASLGNVTVLLSETDIGKAGNPFEAVVTIGDGARLTVAGDNQNPGMFKIEAMNKIAAFDSVRIESVSGFGISTGISRVESDTLAAINVNGAILESKAGDVYLTAKTDSTVSTSANLFVATALTGGAGAEATTNTKAANQINLDSGSIKGSDVHLYAGKDSSEVPNIIFSFANVELTALSMLPNIAVPIPTVDIRETNTVNVLNGSSIQALEDVNLAAQEGIGGKDRRMTDGVALSLSLIPYGFPIPGYGELISTNRVNVDTTARIEAGINNQAILLIKPVTLMGEQNIDPARLEPDAADRILTQEDKLKEAISYVFVSDQDVVKVAEGANKGGEVGNCYRYIGDNAEIVLSEQNYSNTAQWQDVTGSTTDEDVTYFSDYVTEVEYEYLALNAGEIAFTVYTGTVIQVVDEDPENPFAGQGEIGAFYRYRIESNDAARIDLNQEDFTDPSRWEKLVIAYDLEILGQGEVPLQKGQIVRTADNELYRYLGENIAAIDLHEEEYGDSDQWGQLGPNIYRSDVTLALQETLQNKFYVIKPTRVEAPTLSLQNVGAILLAQRREILDWIANHSSNPEAVARYEIALALVEETLEELGLIDIVEDQSGEMVKVANEGLDVLFVEVPDIYASPGSIFIRADAVSRNVFEPLVDNQLVARAGAKISVFNETPFTMTVSDLMIRDTRRVAVVDGEYTVLSPGNVYFNNKGLTTVQDPGPKNVSVTQDSLSRNPADYDLDLEIPEKIGQDLYILGQVVNEVGDVTLINNEGSINVSGEIRAKNVIIRAAEDFNLDTEDWFHIMDPRQYPGLDAFRKLVFDQVGNLPKTYDDNPFDVDPWSGAVLAQGRVAVTARYLNINGLIQSGVQTITLYVDASFAPTETTSFLDKDGRPIAGISFGADRVPVDGYFDVQKGAVVVNEIIPKGGTIDLAGQILSTGNGMLRVAHGYSDVDIRNDSSYDLILNRIDTTIMRVGRITITDTARLHKVVYEMDGEQVKETVFQGTVSEVPGSGGSRIVYEEVGSAGYDLSEDGSLIDTETGETVQYEPREGLHYVWTEGQEKTTVTVTYYKKRFFNLLGFDWDALAKDQNYEWTKTEYRDEVPLLESEVLAVEPNYVVALPAPVTIQTGQTVKTSDGTVYMYHGPREEIDLSTADFTDAAKWVRAIETPGYANDTAYTVQYELRKDTDVELYQNISIVKVVKDANQGGVVGNRYLYLGENAELVLREQDYSDDTKWQDVTNNSAYPGYDYESDFLNYSFEYRTWTTGGGWLRYKTIHMLTTQTEGQKDYYTHTLKADYPIGLQFLQGPAVPSISIQAKGDLYLQGTITAPAEGAVSLVSTAGSVLFGDEAAVLGVSPTIEAAKTVRVNVEGGNAPNPASSLIPLSNGNDSQGVSITSAGDIDIRVVFDPEGNQSSTLVVGEIISTGGNVTLHAGEGIQAFDLSSLVSGNRIEFYTRGGSIGTAGMPLPVDSDVLGSGGVAARAYGDIYIRETSGDLKLGRPQSWEDVEASIHSETGDVVLEAVNGAILDAFYEEFRPRTQEEAEALDQRLQLTGEQAQAAAEASIRAEENTQTQLYHTYWETYRDAKPGEVARELEIEILDAGLNLITFSRVHGLQTGDQVFFSVGIDLGREDYSEASRWAEVVPDYDLQTVTGPVDLETDQVVRTADGTLYQYLGEQEASVDLAGEDFTDSGRWAQMIPEYDLEILEPGARVMLQTEQIVRTSDGAFYRYRGESVSMPYSNLEKGFAYYAVVENDTTIRLALSRYDAAISETPIVLDIKIEGSDDVVLYRNQGDFSHVNMLAFAYTYGDLNEDFSDLDERYQTVHQTYGEETYDPNFIYQVSDQERQERIAGRTFSSGALRYPISQSLFSFLYPDAEGGGAEAPAEMPNVLANHVTLKSSAQIGRVTGTVVIDLSVGFENLPVEHQEILTYAGVDDVVSVIYDPDDPNQIQTLTLQVWNDVNVEAFSAVTVTAVGGIALEAEGDLLVDSIEAGGAVRLVAGGAILDNYTEGSGAAIRSFGDLTLVSEKESIGSADQWLRVHVQEPALLTARAAGSVFVEGQAGALHVDQVEATSGDVWLMVRDSLSAGDDLVIEGEGSVKAGGSVSLLAGYSLRMETGSRVEAVGQVLIHGDYGNADPGVGCVLDIGGGIFGTSIEVRGDGDDDVINVSVLPEGMAMTIVGGGGENTINVGRLSTWTAGLVDGIAGALTVMSEEGLDTLNIDDSGDETDNTGFLRGTTLSGLGMGSGEIRFIDVEVVNMFLGGGDDLFFVEESTEQSVINVNLGPGDDGIELFDGRFITGTLDGGEGTDTLDYHRWSSGVEVDLLRGAATGVYLGREGGVRGFENAVGGSGDDLLIGDHGPNLLIGNDRDDRIFGNGGDDILIGGRGDDYLEGGEGNDIYVFAGGKLGKDTIFEVGDRDRFGRVNDPHDLLDFSDFPGPVEISLNRTSAQVLGAGGEEPIHDLVLTILSATGIEDVIGSAYDDRIMGNERNNTLWGGEGNDWLYGGAGDDVLYGGPGNDRLYGNRGDDRLAGGEGDDWIDGGAGTDLLFFPGAEEGVEVVLTDGGYGWSTDGLGGRDTLLGRIDGAIGTAFDDVLIGDIRPNVFYLGEGNNVVETGAGNDTVMWSKDGGENLIDLGPGWNRVVITLDDEEDLVSLTGAEKGLVEIAGSDGLENGWMLPVIGAKVVEMYTLGGDDEVVIGDLKAAGVYEVVLYLGGGDDRVEGSDATTRIRADGEGGNDYFVGGWGQDYFDGGEGINWVDYSSAPGPVQVHMGGWAYRDGRGSWDYLQNIRNLIGTEFDDVIWGTEEDNVIDALGGNDRVWGMGGDDTLYGGEGDDWLYGGAGDDVLYGGPGDDRLHGNTGNDSLYGGPGKDTLLGGRGNNLLVPNEGGAGPAVKNLGSLVKMETEPGAGKDEPSSAPFAETNRNAWLVELLVESEKVRYNPFEPRSALQIAIGEEEEEESTEDAP
jgi:Ca2+-binding RTX toxin-like protein